jgi:hypothetical protein
MPLSMTMSATGKTCSKNSTDGRPPIATLEIQN